jgi:hypothetical protein
LFLPANDKAPASGIINPSDFGAGRSCRGAALRTPPQQGRMSVCAIPAC